MGGTSLAADWNPDKPGGLHSQLRTKVGAAPKSRPVEIAGLFAESAVKRPS